MTQFEIRDLVTAKINKMNRASNAFNHTLESTNRLTNIGVGIPYNRSTTAILNARQKVEEFEERQDRAKNSAGKLKSIWSGMGGAIKSAMAAISAKKILDLADSMTATRARLDLMNDGLQKTEELQRKIMASANRSRASYLSTADAVSKMGIMAKDAFNSNEELIAFTELINKQFTIAGASAVGIDAAMLQLTQAMSSGVLRGEELNSVFEQAPTIIQTVAEYLKVPIGKIREMAQEGQITSTIVKNAMLSSADKINKKFENMPMTFAQVWSITKNILLDAFMPVLTTIGKGAQWIYDNWSMIAPIFWGLAGAVAVYTTATMMLTAWNWLAENSFKALFATLMSNPFILVAVLAGIVIAKIYEWIQSVGGLRIAWMMTCNKIISVWDQIKIAFMAGVYWVANMIDKMMLAFMRMDVGVSNWVGDMKANVLMTLQGMVNNAINIINSFIDVLNKIPGVSIDAVQQVTFGTTAQLQNEANKQARNQQLTNFENQVRQQKNDRSVQLNLMRSNARLERTMRELEISSAQAKAASGTSNEPNSNSGNIANVGKVGAVGSIDEDVNISEEDLRFLRDVAEMRYVQNFVTLTPTVAVDAKISEKVDVDDVVKRIETKLEDEFVAAAEGVYA